MIEYMDIWRCKLCRRILGGGYVEDHMSIHFKHSEIYFTHVDYIPELSH
jgi:hypothetical protein